jgi:hypothetical protein
MAKLLSLTYVLLSFVSTSAASTECQDGKCDSANDGDAGVLLQARARVSPVSPERLSIPTVFLKFPMKSIPHGPALLQMKEATEEQTFCFTTENSSSGDGVVGHAPEYKADGVEVIEKPILVKGTAGQNFSVYLNTSMQTGVWCCAGTPPTGIDIAHDTCTYHGAAPSLMQAKMIVHASSAAEDSEAVDQIVQLAKQSPDDTAFIVENEQVYHAVLNELGDHMAKAKISWWMQQIVHSPVIQNFANFFADPFGSLVYGWSQNHGSNHGGGWYR